MEDTNETLFLGSSREQLIKKSGNQRVSRNFFLFIKKIKLGMNYASIYNINARSTAYVRIWRHKIQNDASDRVSIVRHNR